MTEKWRKVILCVLFALMIACLLFVAFLGAFVYGVDSASAAPQYTPTPAPFDVNPPAPLGCEKVLAIDGGGNSYWRNDCEHIYMPFVAVP